MVIAENLLDIPSNIISTVIFVFENYGWYLLALTIILVYVYQNYIKSILQKYKQQKDEAEYAAKYHKNPDLLTARLTAQQAAAEKLQQKYQQDAEEFKRKQEEKEAKKRDEFLQKTEGKSGKKLGNNSDSSFKPDYNPLMGSGSSSNYRPPRRSPCGGGGCGR